VEGREAAIKCTAGFILLMYAGVSNLCLIIPTLKGVYNVCSPNPVTNNIFMKTLRKLTGNSIGFPAYEWMLDVGAAIIGTEPELILKSRWVLPTKLLQEGFTFSFPYIEDAFKDIISKVPRKKYHLF
jgi:uncharacterized protein